MQAQNRSLPAITVYSLVVVPPFTKPQGNIQQSGHFTDENIDPERICHKRPTQIVLLLLT